jgi:hypothetical protein
MKTTTMEIKLSEVASAVLNEMARHSGVGVNAAAVGRVCLEITLAQAIDRAISEVGDEYWCRAAKNPDRTCREVWREVEKPGFIYRKAMAAA